VKNVDAKDIYHNTIGGSSRAQPYASVITVYEEDASQASKKCCLMFVNCSVQPIFELHSTQVNSLDIIHIIERWCKLRMTYDEAFT